MFAAIALLVLMIFTVAMFEVTVNNRPRQPKQQPDEDEPTEQAVSSLPDVPKP